MNQNIKPPTIFHLSKVMENNDSLTEEKHEKNIFFY